MKVQLKVSISGTRDGEDWPAIGSIIDLPDGEAADMLAAGNAVEVVGKIQTATAPAPEATTAPRARKKA